MKKILSLLIIAVTFILSVSMYVKTSNSYETQKTIINDQIGLLEVSVEKGI